MATTIEFDLPLPSHFAHLSFLNSTPELFKDFEQSFEGLEKLKIKVHVYVQPFKTIKKDPEWSEDLKEGIVHLPCTQYRDKGGLTELPDEKEFHSSVKKYLENAVKDYAKQNKEDIEDESKD